MKKLYLSLTVVLMAFVITACGMTSEEIDAAITQLDTTYQSGTYSQAQEEITNLEKSYKKMSDEQKTKFDTLKSSVEYASKSVEAINYGLNNAQGFYDQKLYYEAQQELEKISNAYTLPPAQQKIYDEKKSAIDTAIKDWKITEAFQKVETAYNSGDYDTATNELSNIDTSTLSQAQNQTYQSWQGNIADAKAKQSAEKAAAEKAAAQSAQNATRDLMSKAMSAARSAYPGWIVAETNPNGSQSCYVIIENGNLRKQLEVNSYGVITNDLSLPDKSQVEYHESMGY